MEGSALVRWPIPPIGCALLAVALAGPAQAQKLLNRDLPPNAAENDPYTEGGDPELMKGAGILSHGGFEYANGVTKDTDRFMATSDIRWLETPHFELGMALGYYKIPQKEKKKLFKDLTRLAERLPTVNPKSKTLDPWLRAHLYAMRLEDMYADFLSLVQMKPGDFPSGPGHWNRRGTYNGEGPHLGERGKFEVLLLPSKAAHLNFLGHNYGLTLERTQRWNVIERDSISLTIHLEQGSLRKDPALHGHVAFNMAHNFFDGLRHYTYDTPIWLHEGLAHWMERRVYRDTNTFDGAEGSVPVTSRVKDWEAQVRKIVSKGDAPRMASLTRINNYGQMKLVDHFCTWSMVDYLYRTRPDKLGALLRGLKGQMTAEGFGDGSNIPDLHRELFKELFSMSYSAFDKAWAEWVMSTY